MLCLLRREELTFPDLRCRLPLVCLEYCWCYFCTGEIFAEIICYSMNGNSFFLLRKHDGRVKATEILLVKVFWILSSVWSDHEDVVHTSEPANAFEVQIT